MNQRIQSPRRRQLMIAALAGSTVPGTVFGGLLEGATADPARGALREGDRLIVSGRIVDAHEQPVTDALIEMLSGAADRSVRTSTDGDGRFVLTMSASAAQSQIDYRVSRPQRGAVIRSLHFAPARGFERETVAFLQRDDAGTWRTTFGLTLA